MIDFTFHYMHIHEKSSRKRKKVLKNVTARESRQYSSILLLFWLFPVVVSSWTCVPFFSNQKRKQSKGGVICTLSLFQVLN